MVVEEKLEEKKNQQQKIKLKSVRHSFETGYRYKNNDTQNERLERREAAQATHVLPPHPSNRRSNYTLLFFETRNA